MVFAQYSDNILSYIIRYWNDHQSENLLEIIYILMNIQQHSI